MQWTGFIFFYLFYVDFERESVALVACAAGAGGGGCWGRWWQWSYCEMSDNSRCFCAGLGEADLNQNNGCSSKSPVVTDSMNATVDHSSWNHPSTADPNASEPRPHLVRLFSRDAPGREDNTFKDRPSQSDELQTIQEHSGSDSECGSECAE